MFAAKSDYELPRAGREQVFFAESLREGSGWQDEVTNSLRDEVYVSLDVDVFDPSIMPSTGTPEPGGLGWYEVLSLLKLVSEKKRIVGFDVVEFSPNPANKAPDFLVAKLIYKMIGYCYR